EQVAIAGVHHHVELGVGQFQAGGERNGATVRGVERVLFHVAGNPPAATDAGDNGDVSGVNLGIDERVDEGVDAGANAAARTPDVGNAVHAQEGFHWVLGSHFGQLAHRATSRMVCRMSSGRCTLPPACPTKRTIALPAAARSTSRTICPRFSSTTTNAFTLAAISAICFSGKGQAVIRRNLPTFTPFLRANSMARCATREVMPYDTTTTSAPSICSSSYRVILSTFFVILSFSRRTSLSWVGGVISG